MYKITEIFRTICGEGMYTGISAVFVRFSGCTMKHACYAMGVRCDTEFEGYQVMPIDEIIAAIREAAGDHTQHIVLTGGEPLDQLDMALLAGLLAEFPEGSGWSLQIETSGGRRMDWIPAEIFLSISPKVAWHVVRKNLGRNVYPDEVRFVIGYGAYPPPVSDFSPRPRQCFVSPHNNGDTLDPESNAWCADMIARQIGTFAGYRLGIQLHKILGMR